MGSREEVVLSILYTNAILSVRSSQLLNADRIRRMIAAPNERMASEVLYECGWNIEGADIIEVERKRTIREFIELCPSEILRDIIVAKSEFVMEGIQEYYDGQFVRLGKLKNRAITNYFVAEVDLLNLRTFAKLRLVGGKPEGMFIGGGQIAERDALTLFERKPEGIKTSLAHLGYGALLETLVEGLNNGDLAEFENASLTYLVELSKQGAEDSFRLNMLFHWFVAKSEELRIVKTILTGKKFGKSRDELREELRGVI